MAWEQGIESPNPEGRPPKRRSWSAAIERAIYRRAHDDPQALEKLAEKLVIAAENGDLGALKEIGDRIEGKSLQLMQITKENPFEDMSAEDVIKLRDSIRKQLGYNGKASGLRPETQEARIIQAIPEAEGISQSGEEIP